MIRWRAMVSKDDLLVGLKWLSAWCLTQFAGIGIPLQTLVWFVVIDSISGVLAAICQGRGLSSAAGGFGVMKKVAMFLALWAANRADIALASTMAHVLSLQATFTVLFCFNEGVSILENCSRLSPGVIPDGILNALYVLQKAQKLTIIDRMNKAFAVFAGVDPNEVTRGKDIADSGKRA